MAGRTSSRSNTKTSGKKTAKKAVDKKASARRGQTAGKGRKGRGTSDKPAKRHTLLTQLMPFLLGLLSLLILLSIIVPSMMGGLGPFLKNTLFGLFSGAAFFVPILMIVGAFLWRRDVANGAVWYKIIFAVLFMISASVLLHIFLGGKAADIADYDVVAFFKSGTQMSGGGVIGGIIGELLHKLIGSVGTVIITLLICIILGIFYVGLTPYIIWLNIAYALHERRERRRQLEEEYEEEEDDERAFPAWVASQEYYTEKNDTYRRERSTSRDDEGDRRTRSGKRAELDTSDENISVDDPEPEKKPRRVPKILGKKKISDGFEEAFEASDDAAENDSPDSDTIDPAVFESVLRKQTEALASAGTAVDPTDVEEEFDPADGSEIVFNENGVAETQAEKLASFPKESEGAEGGDNPLSHELLEKFLTNSDERGNGAAEFDREYTEAITNGPKDPELLLQRDTLGTDIPTAPPRSKPKYTFPPITLLSAPVLPPNTDVSEELQTTAKKLVDTLTSFKVRTRIVNVSRGPTITRYELAPEEGVRVRSISALVDDISLSLATSGVRIEAPIPGKAAVGIEVPNRVVATVYLRELVSNEKFTSAESKVTVCLGEDVAGEPIYIDIAKMPHLLIAGATGMGKSVCINSMIVSLLYKAKPDEVKLMLVDPKKVELNIYNGLPHLLVPVVTDPKKSAGALSWAVTEMERRFTLIEEVGARDLKGYNKIADKDPEYDKLPHIVIVIDELADLMMTAPDDVEESICRLAQKARAAGMHLIIGTQRPSVDVITGLIKANVPSRIAFTTASQIDSRTIIDIPGAEKLIGRGDMLFAPVGAAKPIRVQGSYVSETEIESIIEFIAKTYGASEYDSDIIELIEQEAAKCGVSGKKGGGAGAIDDGADGESDPMLKAAIELAVDSGKISTSLIQRRLSLGYGRAAKLIDRMEQMGIVSPPEGQKPRNVLITRQQFMEMVIRDEPIE